MSSRAQARMYPGGSWGTGSGAGGNGLLSLLSGLFGQDKISGGITPDENPETGEPSGSYSYTPEQGSSGVFGGPSRALAAQLRALSGSQVLQQQGASRLSAQEAQQAQAASTLATAHAKELMNNSALLDFFKTNNIPPNAQQDLINRISTEFGNNLVQQQGNIREGLQSPEVKQATKGRLVAEAQRPGYENAASLKQNVAMGGTGYAPNPNPLSTGMGTTVSGATPGGTAIQQIQIGKDKQGNPIMSPIPAQVTAPYTRGGVSTGIPDSILNGAQNITPGAATATPGGNMGFLSTNEGPSGQPQPALGTGMNQQQGQQGMMSSILSQLLSNAGRTIGGNMLETGKQNLKTAGNMGSSILPILKLLLNINNPDTNPDNATQ